MGRRALRKPDPNLDLGGYFRPLEELPRPWDVTALFGRVAPLEIEIGSGKGLFLRSAAATHPDHDYLGIEVAHKYARHAAAGLAKRGLRNGVVVHGDGVKLLTELIPDSSVVAVHIYFPDPWWKARHKKRRVVREETLHQIERILVPGGSLHFWTDVEEYFQTGLALVAEHTQLQGPVEVPETPAEHDLDYRTHFERRTRLHSQPVYRAEFRK